MKTIGDKREITFEFEPVDQKGNSNVILHNPDYENGNEEIDYITSVTYAMDLANAIACATLKFQDVCKFLNVSEKQQNEIMSNIFKGMKIAKDDSDEE